MYQKDESIIIEATLRKPSEQKLWKNVLKVFEDSPKFFNGDVNFPSITLDKNKNKAIFKSRNCYITLAEYLSN